MKFTLTFIVCFGYFAAAWAQTESVRQFSLKEAQEYAETYSYTLENAKRDVLIAKKQVWETTAIGLPQISSTLSYSYMLTVPEAIEQFNSFSELPIFMSSVSQSLNQLTGGQFPVIPMPEEQESTSIDDMKWNSSLTIQVSQLVFSGPYLVGLQASKTYKQLSELAYVKSRQDVLETVTNSYYLVLVAQANKDILQSTYDNIEKTLNDIKAMYKEGFVEETDVDQLRITAANIKNSISMLERQTELAKRLLKFQMGLDMSQPIELSTSLDDVIENTNFNQIISQDFILEQNVSYKLLQTQENLTELNLKRYKSECLPSLAAFYQHEENFNDNAFTFNPPDLIGLSLSIPIFASGMRHAKITKAQIEMEKMKTAKKQASQGLILQYHQAKTSYLTAYDNFEVQKENLELAKKIYDKTYIKYKEGVSSSLDLTQTHGQYLQTQSTYFTALQSLLQAKTALEKILNQF